MRGAKTHFQICKFSKYLLRRHSISGSLWMATFHQKEAYPREKWDLEAEIHQGGGVGVGQGLPRVLLKRDPEMTAVWELREQPGHFGARRKSSRIFLEQNIWLYSGYKSNGSQNLKKTFEPLWKRTFLYFLKIYFFVLLLLFSSFQKAIKSLCFSIIVICVSTWQYKEDRISSKEYSVISGYLWNAGSYYPLVFNTLIFLCSIIKQKSPECIESMGFPNSLEPVLICLQRS